MNILVTNDDGIECVGLTSLIEPLSKIGNVFVCAPDSERSCTSHCMTISGKVKIEKYEKFKEGVKAYKIYGSTCDCVRFGLKCLFEEKIDLIVSGINNAPNIASDIIYSSTIAGAREGLINGIPSIAIAAHNRIITNFEPHIKVLLGVIPKFMEDPHNRDYFLSINVPDVEELKELVVCDKYSHRDYNEHYRHEVIDGVDYVTLNETTLADNNDDNDLMYEVTAYKKGHPTLAAYRLSQLEDGYTDLLIDRYL